MPTRSCARPATASPRSRRCERPALWGRMAHGLAIPDLRRIFWPFYLCKHSRPQTRAIHYVGTIGSALVLVWALATHNWWWLLAVPAFGYAPAWIGHFFID